MGFFDDPFGEIEDTLQDAGRGIETFLDDTVHTLESFIYGDKQDDAQTAPPKPPPAPTVDAAQQVASQRIREDVMKRRASRTLFTSGFGALDAPMTASQTLLGQ